MKKDRSNRSSSSNRSLGLPKESILRGRSNFQRLFDDKTAIAFFSSHLKLRARIFDTEAFECKMGFIAPKKTGKAVERNRLKRLLREAYRLNQYILKDSVKAASVGFHGALMAKTIHVDFATAEKEVIDLLDKIRAYIHSNYGL